MAKLSELLVATLAMTAMVACGDDTSSSAEGDKSDADVAAGGNGSGGEGSGGGAITGGDSTGGTPTGGTPTGGTPTGGTPTGGTGGEGTGGTIPPPPEGCMDGDAVCAPAGPSQAVCDVDPCTWSAAGDWAPAARVSYINVPANPDCAAMVGCRLFGTANGTALAGLLPLLNPDGPQPQPGECGDSGLSAFVQPDETGDIQLKLLSRLFGADAGEVFGATGDIDLQLFTGDATATPSDWTIDPVSFAAGTMDPLIHFPGATVASNGLLHTPASRFSLTLPVQGLPIALALEASQVAGYAGIGAEGTGFKLSDGLIGGYLTRESITALLSGLQLACDPSAPEPPSFCGTLNGILPPGSCTPEDCEDGIALISSFLGGFDAKVDGSGAPGECNPQLADDCNAIGVCLEVEMEGVNITGITAAQ